MATNFVQKGDVVTCKFTSAKTSGTFVYIGEDFCGVLLADTVQYGTSDYRAAVKCVGVFSLSLEAKIAAGAGSAITFGDKIYWAGTKLNKADNGQYAGTYVGLVDITSAATATGPMRLKGGS
ncbi:MAG: capsid cement protein [bacterium]